LLDLSILNGPGEAALHGRVVAGEGVTYNAPLLYKRADRELAIISEGTAPRRNNISTNEANKEGSSK